MNISVDSIDIPEATTQIDPEQLKGIVDSIKEIGLSHPIIVRPTNNSRYILVAGEKRLLAYKELKLTEIPAEVRNITEKEGRNVRLQENLKRFNLSWPEQVVLIEELHVLRQTEHGVATRGRPRETEEKVGWGLRDTAEELQMGVGPLSENLALARALRMDATLANVKDKKTAIKLMRIEANRFQAETEAGIPKQDNLHNSVLLGDATEILKQIPDKSVDHSITDPPWIKFFDHKLRIDERTVPVFRELYRVLKSGAFLYMFCGLQDYAYYAGMDYPDEQNPTETRHQTGVLERIGFTVSKTPILWQKINTLSRRGVAAWEYGRDFEFIIVAVKGSPALTTSRQLSAIKPHKIVHPPSMIHANEKPSEIVEDLIEDCSYEGNVIIDPFAGSGVLASACKKKLRKFICIERDKKAYDAIMKRLEGEKK